MLLRCVRNAIQLTYLVIKTYHPTVKGKDSVQQHNLLSSQGVQNSLRRWEIKVVYCALFHAQCNKRIYGIIHFAGKEKNIYSYHSSDIFVKQLITGTKITGKWESPIEIIPRMLKRNKYMKESSLAKNTSTILLASSLHDLFWPGGRGWGR